MSFTVTSEPANGANQLLSTFSYCEEESARVRETFFICHFFSLKNLELKALLFTDWLMKVKVTVKVNHDLSLQM